MRIKRWFAWGSALALVVVATAYFWLASSLPAIDGEKGMPGLSAPATAAADDLGIPAIVAASRADAFRVLGYMHAQDRLFQMELMRRKSAGRLAELFGEAAVGLDRQQRAFGFARAAQAIAQALPDAHKQALSAYTEGVNAYLAEKQGLLPPEFILLRHRPEPWRPEDSLLVALGMFQTLNGHDQDERMLSVMEKSLPAELLEFLTPDTDAYTTVLLGGKESRRPPRPVPVDALSALARTDNGLAQGGVDAIAVIAGSNNWAVSGRKTRDGRAIVANDMHLNLGVPNIWYRASLRYGNRELSGVTLPGLPLVVVGSNGHVAWGFTNVEGDVLDLVGLELNPDNPEEYRTPMGWQQFIRRTETIRVKGGADVVFESKSTIWGPVSPQPLLGRPVAIHWTALDPAAVDLGLLEMDAAVTLEQAMAVMNHFGGPNQNVALADDKGRIGWTLMGRYPLRRGFDGSASRSWADGHSRWDGYIPPGQLPRLVDPPQGYLATANNRTLGRDYPYIIAHNQANGYRAFRISERLREMQQIGERDLFELQLDVHSEFFEFYRKLALAELDRDARGEPLLEEAGRDIEAWDGNMDAGSHGIGLLWTFRQKLADAVFAPVVARGRQLEPDFTYAWRDMETPLRTLLTEKEPAALPNPGYRDWHGLILQVLRESAQELKKKHEVSSLAELPWGKLNRVDIPHPFSKAMPILSPLLDMPEAELPGCSGFCVRIVSDGHGASERMVVSPDHPQDGILHMPGGQSGHPLSAHYRDQQRAWRDGVSLPFLPGQARGSLRFAPAGQD